MTQLKLIAREPTEEMLDAAYKAVKKSSSLSGYIDIRGMLEAMFDAAPIIETKVENLTDDLVRVAREAVIAVDDGSPLENIAEDVEVAIRALLLERGIK